MTKSQRLALIRERHVARASWLDQPEQWPTHEDLPQVEIADLVRTYQATVEPKSQD